MRKKRSAALHKRQKHNMAHNGGKVARGQAQTPQQKVTVQSSEFYSGPMPHPDMLRKYDDVLPGAAERIMAILEGQTSHRQQMERIVIEAKVYNSKIGPVFGGVLAITIIFFAGFMAWLGFEVIATAIVGIDVVGLVGLYLKQTSLSRDDRRLLQDVKNKEKR